MLAYLTGKSLRRHYRFGFHTAAAACERFTLRSLVAPGANVDDTDYFHAVRDLTHQVNIRLHQLTQAPQALQAEQLISLGLIHDALRFLIRRYCLQDNPGIIGEGLAWVAARLGEPELNKLPPAFIRLFPPRSVMQGTETGTAFLAGTTDEFANRDAVVLETILLYLTMRNPATRPLRVLFDDQDLQKQSPYVPVVVGLEEFFAEQPPVGSQGVTLFQCLRAPMLASPDSLEGQLWYIREHWRDLLPDELVARLTLALDVWREDRRLRGLGPGPTPVLEFGRAAWVEDEPEYARFSQDRDWMSNVVLMAKSVYVWLDQLSRRYQRQIHWLSDIPDEELDRLARWGFNGLWLIGLWERAPASQKLKQYMGNPEAAASAYSLHDYTIAADLGGEEAYRNLRDRARQRGIRLASDMVPNHMGLDSRWVIEHPDWFLQLPQPPYPWYSYTGGDLSSDARVGLFLEDGYWEHRDAAVVFKRVDNQSGEECYIYHGNDGTSMPWNDTAQLDFTLPEVREAVIQTILHVARLFSIIRFDAAMTLAKKHYQRLWFPRPGDAGAIPSRAEQGLTKPEFDAVFPAEFWREVVDRVAAEVPDTLLLAEAFWLMEGYFVRTLGMHRVYNSAFMNMLKMEENSKYRQTVKNVLEFSPEVLKRFVNFMNNPDERTAIEQYGKGDKYYGVAVLMVTMPGLPMFGHGQVEGLTEKYGMEYRRAYWDERIDEDMIRRHEHEIFPLMRRRHLFSGAEHFAFYDFVTGAGDVDENVFAYTNRVEGERALILYNNAYDTTSGQLHTATPVNVGAGDEVVLERRTLAEALDLDCNPGCYYSFRDYRTGLQYLRSASELVEGGLQAELQGYQYSAFLDWQRIADPDGEWTGLAKRLNGGGVPSLDEALQEMRLEPVLTPFRHLLAVDILAGAQEAEPVGPTTGLTTWREALAAWLEAAACYPDFPGQDAAAGQKAAAAPEAPPTGEAAQALSERAAAALAMVLSPEQTLAAAGVSKATRKEFLARSGLPEDKALLRPIAAWLALRQFDRLSVATGASARKDPDPASDDTAPADIMTVRSSAAAENPSLAADPTAVSAAGQDLIDRWLLPQQLVAVWQEQDADQQAAVLDVLLTSTLLSHPALFEPALESSLSATVQEMLRTESAQRFLKVNQYDGALWLNREQLERLVATLTVSAALTLHETGELDETAVRGILESARQVLYAAQLAGYRVRETVQILGSE